MKSELKYNNLTPKGYILKCAQKAWDDVKLPFDCDPTGNFAHNLRLEAAIFAALDAEKELS